MKYNLKEMSLMEKPREKLYQFGAESLADYELLAIILRTGSKELSVLDLSIKILKQIGSINALSNISMEELLNFKGIGKIKAIELLATIELSKRINDYSKMNHYIKSSKDAYDYLKSSLIHLEQEHFIAIYLSSNNKIINKKIISIGSSTKTIINPKDIIRWGIKLCAFGVLVSHNHPGGSSKPSQQDINFTLEFQKICDMVDLVFIDHIIIGKNNYFSFKEKSIFKD